MPARTATIIPETSAKRTGAWTAKSGSGFLNSKALTASARGARLTFTFTGRAAAVVMTRSASSGQAEIYVDGVRVATVDLKGATAYRQAVWAKSLTGSGRHTLMINVLGTKGRPGVGVDGILALS